MPRHRGSHTEGSTQPRLGCVGCRSRSRSYPRQHRCRCLHPLSHRRASRGRAVGATCGGTCGTLRIPGRSRRANPSRARSRRQRNRDREHHRVVRDRGQGGQRQREHLRQEIQKGILQGLAQVADRERKHRDSHDHEGQQEEARERRRVERPRVW